MIRKPQCPFQLCRGFFPGVGSRETTSSFIRSTRCSCRDAASSWRLLNRRQPSFSNAPRTGSAMSVSVSVTGNHQMVATGYACQPRQRDAASLNSCRSHEQLETGAKLSTSRGNVARVVLEEVADAAPIGFDYRQTTQNVSLLHQFPRSGPIVNQCLLFLDGRRCHHRARRNGDILSR